MSLAFDLDGKTAVIATMHGKEQVIEPALAGLGLRFLAAPAIDTDRFGTFTRDIARAGSQRDALLAKAQAGLDLSHEADFAVASEGAFGPHPNIPFVPSGFEMLGVLERKSGKIVIGHHLTTATNFMQVEVRSWAEVQTFAQAIGFPRHAMVVMKSKDGPVLAKGMTSESELKSICHSHFEFRGPVWLEADMRAHLNPTRMEAVTAATADLIRRLQARCPTCVYPDWTPQIRDGRPCAWCNGPTVEAWIEEYVCEACGHEEEQCIEPERKGEPGHCHYCNP
ncbi:MAG: hypothetical protein KKA12_01705 [Alphaproteobacteria bacterium]|nr:hypothetical protein [Alphaproteobacteria bacterium]